MPPQQPFLASGTRGYICRSCISKLQKSYQPRSSWLARKITNDNRPRRSNTTPKPVIKYWEQNGDGQRRENQFQDAAFLEKVERSIKELGDDIGDQRLQEDLQELEEVDAEDKSWEEQEEEQGLEDAYEEYINKSMGVSNDVQSKTDAIYAQMEALDGQMRRLEDNPELENLSAEDRLRIRREALDGIPGINVEGKCYSLHEGDILTLNSYSINPRQSEPANGRLSKSYCYSTTQELWRFSRTFGGRRVSSP